MDMLSKKQKILVIIGIAVAVVIIVWYYVNSTKDVYNYGELLSDTEQNEDIIDEDKENKIIVHITGAVQNEGVVEVKENARVNDVIQSAGGVTEDANLDNVNLAHVVEDGQKIYIPSVHDNSENIDDGDVIVQNSNSGVIENIDETSNNGMVNINTANATKLQELPGIGASTAQKIVTYRDKNGKFKSIEDIKNVSGIGEAKYDMIKEQICI